MSFTWAAFVLAASLPPSAGTVPRPSLPPIYPMATPSQVTHSLYLDMSGLLERPRLDPHLIITPRWWQYLSHRTRGLHDELRLLDAEDGVKTITYDWLCQCRYKIGYRMLPKILIERSGKESAELTVRLNGNGTSTQLTLFYVWEDGWKIDDIVAHGGQRFSDALKSGIANHSRNHKSLLDRNRN